ncbi:MAG: glycosyltransferase [Prevotella sp.]|nr:glycosyltransferase [Prevotella sp.]
MKLLYFTPLLNNVGGLERTLTDKANFIASDSNEVMIVTYEHDGEPAYELKESVEHVDLACHFFTIYRYPFFRRFSEALRLKRLFHQKLKAVVNRFRPDVVVVTVPNTENFICDVMKVVKPVPVVIESHLAYGYSVIRRGLAEKLLYLVYNPQRAIRRSQLLVALTSGDADNWRRHGVRNIVKIPNPLTRYDMTPPAVEKVPGRIICVGRLTRQKRYDRLIDAFALLADKYPQWHVDIFGQGEDLEELQQRILAKGVRIRILKPTKDIYTEYWRSQFFVMSSDFEGFGLVIIEAMSCGLPIVSTNCPHGPEEIIADGETGLLANLDTSDLAEKIEWMITHESERQAMGASARRAAADYLCKDVAKRWEQAYKSVIAK